MRLNKVAKRTTEGKRIMKERQEQLKKKIVRFKPCIKCGEATKYNFCIFCCPANARVDPKPIK